MNDTISVVVPTINEHKNVLRIIRALKPLNQIEMIVADGGSKDGTCQIAERYCRVISCDPGRANQMNKGAQQASGDILWFLHADSIVTTKMADEIRNALADPSVIGGGFSIHFDDPSHLLRLIAKGSNLRAKYLRIYFGDQGFFIRRSVFEEIGGFPPVALMEDWLLSQEAKKRGKLLLLSEPILTSSRRFRKNGIIRTFLLMQKIKFLFLCGVPISKLERMYRRG
jgi:rSAM/selenodomain-associated transferase 2